MELRNIDRSELGELLSLYGHLHDTDDPLPDAARIEAVWEELLANPRCRYVGAGFSGSEKYAFIAKPDTAARA